MRVEPPLWYRVFDLAAWDEPDAQELSMTAGLGGTGDLRRMHAERRWGEAKHAYRREYPALAEQEFAEIAASRARRRD